MTQSLNRATLEAMSRDELVDVILALDERVNALEDATDDLPNIRARTNGLNSAVDRLEDDVADLETQHDQDIHQLHRERSKVTRRLSVVEDDVGIAATDALAVAEAGQDAHQMTRLARMLRHGPHAVVDNPSATHYRAKELVENWNRWGDTHSFDRTKERRLACVEHDLKTRLEDARDEDLAWRQVYRAMKLVENWSDGKIELREGTDGEGKYVLIHEVARE